jgi:MFS family permease
MAEKKKGHRKTLFALGFGNFIDQGEAQAMSVLSPLIQSMWGLSFAQLGLMTTLRNITQTISAPFWGYAADKFSRKKVLILGTGIWGLWTLAIGFVPDYKTMIVLRAISGLGLGCLMPATFSLIADLYSHNRRGMALGTIAMVGLFGTVIGVIALGFLATEELWRWGFIGLGLFSILSGIVIYFLVEEPPRGAAEPELAGIITHADENRFSINVSDVFKILRIPTIWAAIIQGVTGTMPWVVLGFYFINWLVRELGYSESISLDHPQGSAPLIFATIVIGSGISRFIGGIIGDTAERINPKYGRTVIGQFSVLIGVPLTYYLFTQSQNLSFGQLVGFSFFTALLIGWPGPGAKEPMMQAVVVPELRSSAFSVVSVIEGGLSAFSGLIAGLLADQIGFTNALLWTVTFPWLICGIFFSLFYFTYPKDEKRVRDLMEERRKQLIEYRESNG